MTKKKRVKPGSARDVPAGHVRLKRPRHRGTVNETWCVKVVPPTAPDHVDQVADGWSKHQRGPRHSPIPLEAMTPWHQEQERKRQAAEARDAGAPRPKARRKSRTSSPDG